VAAEAAARKEMTKDRTSTLATTRRNREIHKLAAERHHRSVRLADRPMERAGTPGRERGTRERAWAGFGLKHGTTLAAHWWKKGH
jgi:hypothetical protein